MKKSLIISIVFALISISAKSQYIYLSDDPTMFVEQADSMLKQWGNIGDSTSDNFSAVWFDLSSEDQDKVISMSREFRDRKYPINPMFIIFYNAIYNGIYGEFSERVNLSDFLSVAQKVVENAEDPKDILRYFISSRNLFEHGALYHHQYNVLYIPEGSNFTFEYVEGASFFEPVIPLEVEEALNDDFEEEDIADAEETDDWSDDDWGDDDSWDDDSWDDDTGDSWDDTDDSFGSFDDDENIDNYGDVDAFMDPLGSSAPMVDLPPIEGATIKIENADFDFYSPYDTFQLQNVSGTYVFNSRNFVGDTGSMSITIPFGEYETEADITFSKFAFNTITPSISTENALLSYPDLFDEDISGSFTVKSISPKPSGRKYPVFRSYRSNYEYKNIGEGVKLIGGFTLLGNKISTQGQDLRKNHIEIRRKDELVLKGSSPRFFVRDTLLKSHKVHLTIYHNQDSLTHPSMELNYDMFNSFLTLYWEKGPFKDRPMIDSYHSVDIKADKLSWDLYTEEINFGIINGRSDVPAIVRSLDNFDDQEYLRLKGINQFHPVQVAAYFAMRKKMNEFSFFELAEAYKIKPEVMKSAIIRAAGKGYLEFDEFTGLININEKTKHAYNSNFKKDDFDNMEWYSLSPTGQNITLHLDSMDLEIRGIEKEIMSKALKVYYQPDSGVVVLKDNRDFSFDGEIRAGNYSIKGKKFNFKYDNFSMELTEIDSIRFNLSNDSTGETSQRKILGGEVENTGGMFYLNEPDNKSGRRDLPQYPILDVTKPSYVYFDDPDILGGAYNKKIYFEIPQFKIDTLESDNPSVINVKGIFHSDGMIPNFDAELIVNKDLSLGFTHEVPEEGYPVFGNEEARYFNEVKMNTNGLNGNGKFEYLTSTTEASNVVFYQDSMVVKNAVVDVVAGDTEYGDYPDAKCADARGVLMAANERYIINSKGREMVDLYQGKAKLEGAAMISKKGMFGIGDVRTQGTDSRSKNFRFSKNSFTARDAEFFIEAYDQDTFALTAHDAKLFFDFDKNTARLEPEIEGDAVISLPLMAYKTSIPVGTWDLDSQTFTMVKPDYVDIQNSYFYSTLEDQDSLVFSGESAVYDAVASMLTVKGVPGIYVADAIITPGDSTVIIDESTLIQPLTDASIVMDSYEKHHYLDRADVDIYTRNKFDADGTYVYVNSGLDTMEILFEGLYQVPEDPTKKRTDSITYSDGYIEEDANFYVAPKILYQGDVAVYANRPNLAFDGEIRLDLRHSDEFNDWLPFVYDGSADDIQIELKDEREMEENEPMLTTGIHVDGGESQLYYTLLSSKRIDDDPDIFKVTGLLSIDAETGVFEVGSKEKLSGETNSGNLFVYNDSSAVINFEGEFNLYGYMPPIMTAKSYGKGRVNIDSGNYSLNTLTYLNFPIPGQALNAMGQDMSEEAQYIDDLKEASESNFKMIYKLSQMIGQKAADNYDEQLYIEYIPLYAVSGKFGKSVLFSDLDLKWHKEEGAFYSGDTVGLASIGKNDVNGRVRGYYEIKKIYEDEIINLFIELKPNCWYYFSYDNGRMATYSSNHIYNEIIEAKSKSPESGASQGEVFTASADLYEVTDYIKYYNETYLGKILKDEDVVLKVSKPEVDDKFAGRKGFDEGGSDAGWGGEEPEEEESGWGTEEEFDSGWGASDDEEEDEPFGQESTKEEENEIEEAKEDIIQAIPFGGSDPEDEEEEDSGWGWDDETEESNIIGAPPKKEKKQKEKRVKEKRERKPKEDPILSEKPKKEEESGWGFEEEPKEEEGSGWGFGDEEDDKPVIVSDKKEKEKKVEVEVEKEDEDLGWGFGDDEDEAVEIKSKKEEPKKEKKVVVEEEDEDEGWGFGGDEDESVEIKSKKEEPKEEKKVVVEEDEDDDGWGFGGDDESVEIVNDDKENEDAERLAKEEADKKAKEEADRIAKEKADQIAKEEAERKAKEEAERLAKEEEERKAREEAEKKIVVEEEDDDEGWGFGDEEDDSVEIVNDDKEKEEAERKAKEEADRIAKEKADQIAKEEAERKAKEEAERLAKEEAVKKAREEEERKAKEEAEKKIVVEEGEDEGWGFGDEEDESVEIVNDDKEKEEAEKKAKEEEEKKKKEEEELKAKEEAEKKAKAEEEKKKKEEEERKKKEVESSSEEEEEEDDWDGF